MIPDVILVTGFEPYGGRGSNPAYQAMQAVDGLRIDGVTVVGRGLPVAIDSVIPRLETLFDELRPSGVIGLGLWPGEPAIRIERIGINLADFTIADNAGRLMRDAAVLEGASARFSTLPVREIETALLASGIPARLSVTAGTFLCNACLYGLLAIAERHSPAVPCGFLHLPYAREYVAEMLRTTERPELRQGYELASMELSLIIEAVKISLGVVAAGLRRGTA